MFKTIKLKIRRHFAKDIIKFIDEDIEYYQRLYETWDEVTQSLVAVGTSEDDIKYHQELRDIYFHKCRCMEDFKWRLKHYNIL